MLTNYHQKCKDILKSKGRGPSQQLKEEIFVKEAEKTLFDICSCKCPNPVTARSCEKSRKVPDKEISFLIDQRTQRKMKIGSVDNATTARLQKRKSRRYQDERRGKQRSGSGSGIRKRPKTQGESSSGELTTTSNTDTGTGTDSDYDVEPE